MTHKYSYGVSVSQKWLALKTVQPRSHDLWSERKGPGTGWFLKPRVVIITYAKFLPAHRSV